jgi:hypothetical protein
MGSVIRLAAIVMSGFVLFGFAFFCADELDRGSRTQQQALSNELEGILEDPAPIARTPADEAAREAYGYLTWLQGSMLEALGEWMGFPALFTAYGGTPPPRSGPYHATIVPYGPFKAGDAKTVFLSVQNEREFAQFCDVVLKKPSLKTDPRFSSGPARFRNRDAMHAEIDAVGGLEGAEGLGKRADFKKHLAS